ncbi:MAG: radical SAM protein [Candidatus Caenarcaniphilales bacterium]|jgi:wyosine [tRNA(Phe)-imidazoG37] synthetase (radical SAM superfamily)|nr:radical SAM protein [Candidatus Caenarcaniphilales bacterium]
MKPSITKIYHVYGPVLSWRAGNSLGIDPIGQISTCSFNCSYCQLGKIQNITTEIKTYVATAKIIDDLKELETLGRFRYEDLDVITFAGSGEPTLAENLGDIIDAIKDLYKDRSKQVPISILTNATLLIDNDVLAKAAKADILSLKLDAVDEASLKAINQPAAEIKFENIISGIQKFNNSYPQKSQLQIMLMPKQVSDPEYISKLAQVIHETGVTRIQLNTPSRPKPVSSTGEYWLETRGNHYKAGEAIKPDYIELKELPALDRKTAFEIEDQLQKLCDNKLEIVNIYQRK